MQHVIACRAECRNKRTNVINRVHVNVRSTVFEQQMIIAFQYHNEFGSIARDSILLIQKFTLLMVKNGILNNAIYWHGNNLMLKLV